MSDELSDWNLISNINLTAFHHIMVWDIWLSTNIQSLWGFWLDVANDWPVSGRQSDQWPYINVQSHSRQGVWTVDTSFLCHTRQKRFIGCGSRAASPSCVIGSTIPEDLTSKCFKINFKSSFRLMVIKIRTSAWIKRILHLLTNTDSLNEMCEREKKKPWKDGLLLSAACPSSEDHILYPRFEDGQC